MKYYNCKWMKEGLKIELEEANGFLWIKGSCHGTNNKQEFLCLSHSVLRGEREATMENL